MIICKNCGNINRKGRFCTVCGTALEVPPVQTLICPECGREYMQGRFCVVCGTQLNSKQQPADDGAVLICSRCSKTFLAGAFCTSCGGNLVSQNKIHNNSSVLLKNNSQPDSANQSRTVLPDQPLNEQVQVLSQSISEDCYEDPQNCKTQRGEALCDAAQYKQESDATDTDNSDMALAAFLRQYRAEKYGVDTADAVEAKAEEISYDEQPEEELVQPTEYEDIYTDSRQGEQQTEETAFEDIGSNAVVRQEEIQERFELFSDPVDETPVDSVSIKAYIESAAAAVDIPETQSETGPESEQQQEAFTPENEFTPQPETQQPVCEEPVLEQQLPLQQQFTPVFEVQQSPVQQNIPAPVQPSYTPVSNTGDIDPMFGPVPQMDFTMYSQGASSTQMYSYADNGQLSKQELKAMKKAEKQRLKQEKRRLKQQKKN